ncbi:MAG: hypothetical protein LN416_08205 [Candidatus Thermoplasmatota archaeon]|nr:hypothetical protein [Candidatus Thermoplasmatota archaeon]
MKWFNNNINSFRTGYKKKFVAVHEGQILDSDDHFDKLQKRLKESHKDLDIIDIQYVPSKDAYIVI